MTIQDRHKKKRSVYVSLSTDEEVQLGHICELEKRTIQEQLEYLLIVFAQIAQSESRFRFVSLTDPNERSWGHQVRLSDKIHAQLAEHAVESGLTLSRQASNWVSLAMLIDDKIREAMPLRKEEFLRRMREELYRRLA